MESKNNQNRITRNAEETKILFEKLGKYSKENKMDSIPSSPWMKDMKNLFVLRAQGINMEPRIFDGDYLIIHEQSDAQTGQIGYSEFMMPNGSFLRRFTLINKALAT